MTARIGFGLSLVLALLSLPAVASAADPRFVRDHILTGLYGGPTVKASTLAGDGVMLAGGEAGMVLGHSLVLGGAGYGHVTNVVSPASLQSTTGDAHLGLAYGGMRAAVILGAEWRVHGTFGVLVGGGSAWTEDPSGTFHRSDALFIAEPDLEAELNITRGLRFSLGAGYRFVANAEQPGFGTRRFGGPVGLATFRFGEF